MSAMPQALILAGSRPGSDPLAASAGVSHKALIEIDGMPMLARVAGALRQAGFDRIAVSTQPGPVADLAVTLGLTVIAAQAGPSRSVAVAFEQLGAPLLVTTSDHGLLQAEWITRFVADVPRSADVAALLARRERIEEALPGSRRTYLRFADGAWSGCNLFYLNSPRSAAALELWQMVEADRKKPWRIVRRLGLGPLIAYLRGKLTLHHAVAHLGKLVDVEAAVVESAFGLAAVDVDTQDDLIAVRALAAAAKPSGDGNDRAVRPA